MAPPSADGGEGNEVCREDQPEEVPPAGPMAKRASTQALECKLRMQRARRGRARFFGLVGRYPQTGSKAQPAEV